MATQSVFGQPTSVNFFNQAPETAADLNQLQRQRALAQMLAQRGNTPQESQMVGGHLVTPSKLSYVAQLASALGGGYLNRKTDEQEQSLAQTLMAKRQQDAREFQSALQGTPASTQELAGPPMEGQGAPMRQIAAVPGDTNRALAIAMQSQNPLVSGMAPELFKRQMDAAELQQALAAAGLGGLGGAQTAPGGAAPGIAGAQGAPVQAGFPEGVNPQAAALTLSRNAQANKLGAMFQEAAKPQTVAEGGSVYVPGRGAVFTAPKTEAGIAVQGGRAVPVPGFAEAQAEREGQIASARQAAESANTMVTVEVGGKPTQMTRAQFLAMSGGQQAAPMGGQKIANPLAPRPGESDRAQIYQQERMAIATRLQTAAQSGDAAATARAQQDAMELEKEIKSNKIDLPPMPVPGVQKTPGIVGQTGGEKAYESERAQGFAKTAQKVQETGSAGAGMLRDLDQLKTLYADPNVAKGALAENISGLKNIGASFGIDMKGLSSEQAAQAITNKMALTARSAPDGGMPGAMSDADRNFLKNLQPDLSKTPEGRAKIMDAMQKSAQRQIDIAALATQYEQQNGRIDAGFDKVVRDYASKNQLFTQPTKGGGSKTQINDLLNKYR